MNLSTARRRLTALALGLVVAGTGVVAGSTASTHHGSAGTSVHVEEEGGAVLATWGWGDAKTALPSPVVQAGS